MDGWIEIDDNNSRVYLLVSRASMLRCLWGVAPIMTTNLVEAGLVDSKTFNVALTKAAVTAFDDYIAISSGQQPTLSSASSDILSSGSRRRKRRTGTTLAPFLTSAKHASNRNDSAFRNEIGSGSHKNKLTHNDYFFEHQRTRGYRLATPAIANCQEAFRLQEELIATAAVNYLTAIGDAFQDNNNKAAHAASRQLSGEHGHGLGHSINMWAAVQRGRGAYHADHVHKGVLVSGVYYASVPSKSAPLVLRRPMDTHTGVRAAAVSKEDDDDDDDLIIHPSEGQLILFPPWLLHGVPALRMDKDEDDGPSEHGHLPRVSFAFNVSGSFAGGDPWDVTRIPSLTTY